MHDLEAVTVSEKLDISREFIVGVIKAEQGAKPAKLRKEGRNIAGPGRFSLKGSQNFFKGGFILVKFSGF